MLAISVNYYEFVVAVQEGENVKLVAKWVGVIGLLALLQGCSTSAYLWQATAGHLKVLATSQDIDALLIKPDLTDKLRQQLQHVKEIRAFSIDRLALPDNESYTRYTELNRQYVVWNVVASPTDSLELKKWCFLYTGCISYKGFYKESDATQFADTLRLTGLDVSVLGVPAYSTLGFTPDPVLSSFVYYPAGELARLIFHELAHQVVYIPDDTMFNESFATAVEELGIQDWLSQAGREALREQYLIFDSRRRVFRALLAQAQLDLKQVYASHDVNSKTEILESKKARLEQLKADYSIAKKSWGGWAGYDPFMAVDLNNAKLGLAGLYSQHVVAFKTLFRICGESYPRFYGAVEALGQLPPMQRERLLTELLEQKEAFSAVACSEQGFNSVVQNGATVFEHQK